MKIGLMSDSHKHIVNLSNTIEYLRNLGTEKIIHLGDDYTDIDECGEENVLRVPGVFSDTYQKSEIPNRRVENFTGWRVLLSHTLSSHANDLPDDIKPEDLVQNKKVDMVFYGHTHVPDIKKIHGVIFINPGHLKNDDKKGYPPTFGLLEFLNDNVTVVIYNLKTKSIFKKELFRKGE